MKSSRGLWWVNQNQTHRQEIGGGYMWSPKKDKNGKKVPYYEFMKEVAPGDLIFSFFDTYISYIGIATSHCFEAPRPDDFGAVGEQWESVGWKVSVDFKKLPHRIKPSDNMGVLAPTLPPKYSPIRPDGNGNQVYLAKVPFEMGRALIALAGEDPKEIAEASSRIKKTPPSDEESSVRAAKESHIEEAIKRDPKLTETVKKSLVDARRGQGRFRQEVAKLEPKCRVSGVTNLDHRIASHIKPWSDSDNRERIDGENGLMLAPHIDHLFDRGFISFTDEGLLLISPIADMEALAQLSVPLSGTFNAGSFTKGQKAYLHYHRTEVFKSVS